MSGKANIIIETQQVNGNVKAGRVLSASVASMGDYIAIEAMQNEIAETDTFLYKQRRFKVTKIENLLHRRIRAIAIPG